jgi:hypothetical protein
MTYIGNIQKLKAILAELSSCPGYERLLTEIRSADWEQFESAFAVAIEGHRLHSKGIGVEFAPQMIIESKGRAPDFRAALDRRHTYFEVKASSMFPDEKPFLKIVDKIRDQLDGLSIELKVLVNIHTTEFSESQIGPLTKHIQTVASKLETVPGTVFPQRYCYPNSTSPSAEFIFPGYIHPTLYASQVETQSPFTKNEEFIMIRGTIPQSGGKGQFTILETLTGIRIMYMGSSSFDRFLDRLSSQLFGISKKQLPAQADLFIVNMLMQLSVDKYQLMGMNKPYWPERRVKKIVDDAWTQLPPKNPNVVIIYTREVILRIDEISETLNDLFISKNYAKISAVIADVELASQSKERYLFSNPNASHPLTKNELHFLKSW